MKLVFIDVDNTLLDFDEYVKKTLKEGFRHFSLTEYEPYMYDVFTEENNSLWRAVEEKQITVPELKAVRFNNVFRRLGIAFEGQVFEAYFRQQLYDSAIPVTNSFEMLSYLSGKYILCAATNGPHDQQVHRLEISGMSKYFTYFFTSEKVGYSKPAKEFFDYAFREINENRSEAITPDECVIIGDSATSDMAGGINYGMKTCFYKRPGNMDSTESFDFVAEDLSEIKNYL